MSRKLRVKDVFHIASKYTFLVCEFDHSYDLEIKGDWNLYKSGVYIATLTVKTIVMDNGVLKQMITLPCEGLIDKSIFDFSSVMEVERTSN